jgi:hypothetical protein
LKAEKPAEGILKTNDWGNSKWYHIRCDCGNEDCAHEVNVEAEDFGIQVHVYVKNHTKWWEKNRWKQIWQIITKGYAEMETTIVMNEQTALNYSTVLKTAITDVKNFKSALQVDKQTKE